MSHDRDYPDRRDGADDLAREQSPNFDAEALPPDAEADLGRLRELFQSVSPVEPEEDAWRGALTHIHASVTTGPARLAGPTGRAIRRRTSPRPVWAMLGLVAAAALVAVMLARSWWIQTPSSRPAPAEEPFPVAEADDVNILSIDARDVAGLVVGEPPVSGELVFASLEDVRVLECKCCPKSGNVAKLEPGEVPMLVTTVARVDTPNDE
jgi:hypothetical protein